MERAAAATGADGRFENNGLAMQQVCKLGGEFVHS